VRRYPWRVSYGARLLGGIIVFFFIPKFLVIPSVADPHHVDADPDPDPACHFDADLDPDPSF
jgi:hypothetical protein